MTDSTIQAPVSPAGVPVPPASFPPLQKNKKPRKKKRLGRIIGIVIAAAAIAGIAFGLHKLFFTKDTKGIMTEAVSRGPIQSTVEGNGVTSPKNSQTITLGASGKVLEVLVSQGEYVTKGTPLYRIDSSDALTAVNEAQKNLSSLQKELSNLQESYNNLAVKASFSGKLLQTTSLHAGDSVSAGAKIGVLVDDSKMLLTQYYSYAYESSIRAGMTAQISIPSSMSVISGTVKSVEKVRRVSSEGSLLFRVDFMMDNPGTLTEGMSASAVLTNGSGGSIYPYEAGTLAYNRKADIIAKTAGTVLSSNLYDYSQAAAGALLLQLDSDVYEDQFATLEKQVRDAQETLTEKTKTLDSFNAVAPIDGTVLACNLTAGETAEAGKAAITIADTSVMAIAAQIDELDVNSLSPGMEVTVTQTAMDSTLTYIGRLESVSLEGKFENGVSYFPATVVVDNPDGSLMSGMYVSYSMVTSSKDDCLLVSSQAVKYTENGTCLFVKAGSRPDNAVDLGENVEVPEGFYAVPVQTGLSDNTNVEIVSGVEEGTEVFTQYMVNQGDSYSNGGGMAAAG